MSSTCTQIMCESLPAKGQNTCILLGEMSDESSASYSRSLYEIVSGYTFHIYLGGNKLDVPADQFHILVQSKLIIGRTSESNRAITSSVWEWSMML